MKAIRVIDGAPRLIEMPRPEADSDGVRVRVISSSICGSDLHLIDLGIADGRILGHEFAGITPDGTAVAIEPLVGCGVCHHCVNGLRVACTRGSEIMGVTVDGGMAEEVVVPAATLVPLPGGLDLRTASLVEPLAVAVHGANRARVVASDRVLVVGAGPIGLATAAVLRARGLGCDIAARHRHQQAAAEALGASLDVSDGYDVVIDAVGTTESIAQSVAAARIQGRIGLVGSLWYPAEIDFGVCLRETEIIPASMYGGRPPDREIDEAARILASDPAIADVLITHRFPLDAATEAFATAADRSSGTIKVAFDLT